MKTKKAKNKISKHWDNLKNAIKHFYEDDHIEEMINPKLRIAK